jgi:hypothetical protein
MQFSSIRSSRRNGACRRSHSLQSLPRIFERLEDRRVLTSVSAQAALIAAINSANAAGGNNTITLSKNITLFESTADNTTDGFTGLPAITSGDNLTITGNGHVLARSTSGSNSDFRFFDVESGATLSLKTITLKNGLESGTVPGSYSGGAIFVEQNAALELNAAILTDNSASLTADSFFSADFSLNGGAIFNAGTTTVKNSVISGNSATFTLVNGDDQGNNQGSGATTDDNGDGNGNGAIAKPLIAGGAIYNDSGPLTITASVVSNNSATCTITNGNKNASVGNGNFNGNGDNTGTTDNGNDNGNGDWDSIFVEGGGIYNFGNTATLTNDVISGNRAGCTVVNGSENGNSNGDSSDGTSSGNQNGNGVLGGITIYGGGVYNAGGTLNAGGTSIVANSIFLSVDNSSGNGKGNGGMTDVDTGNHGGNENGNGLDGNIVLFGGGLMNDVNSTVNLNRCTLSANSITSSITNGSGNGNNNGDGDTDPTATDNGNDNGNGVFGNITIAGGALYNSGTFTTNNSSYVTNSVACSVANGNNNGNNNGVHTQNDNGNTNGNGVAGNILLFGGAIANDTGGSVTISHCIIASNSIHFSITNGNNDGDGNGENNAGLGNSEGKNNGNGVAGFVHLSGAGIDNEDASNTDTISNSAVSANSIKSVITNGNNDGNMDGNDDGDGDALASVDNTVDVLVLHGAGIHNVGDLNVSSTIVVGNSITSTIHNGNTDGNNCGNNNQESGDGRANGNAVSGDVLFAGGGIANSGPLDVSKCTLAANFITSSIANGTGDGDNDGQNDGANDNCGINEGDAVFGDVEIDGGGIGNSGTATVHSSTIAGNLLTSTVTNGTNNGQNDGTGSTGADGQGDGNGIDGNLEVHGGGAGNTGTFTLSTDSSVTGNVIHNTPASGAGDTTLDGKVVNGTVTVSGTNKF